VRIIANNSLPFPVAQTTGTAAVAQVSRGHRIKRYAFRAVAIFLGVLMALVLCEVALRIAGWSAPGFYIQGRGPVNLRNSGRDGGAYPPGARGELRHYDYSVQCIVNSYGFRDAEIIPKRPGEWRIGVLGDSFTAGVGVNQSERFADIFRAEIQRRRSDVTVVNLGAPLCGTACEAAMLDRVSRDYQLDEIVLAFYGGNDVEENTAWYLQLNRPPSDERTVSMKAKDWLREHSRLSTFLWVSGVRAFATFRPPGIYSQTDLERSWADTEQSLKQLKASVGNRKLTILYLPAVPEWSDEVWREMRTRYGVPEEGRHLVRTALARWSRDNQFAWVDATDWLRQCSSVKDCDFPVDGHWNARGHLLVAQGLLGLPYWAEPRR
jgi:hypothetical protein